MASQKVQKVAGVADFPVLEAFFTDVYENTKKNLSKKLRDNNTIKSNAANPYDRVVAVGKVHSWIFKRLFFLNTDDDDDDDTSHHHADATNDSPSNKFVLRTITQLQKFFPIQSILKFH